MFFALLAFSFITVLSILLRARLELLEKAAEEQITAGTQSNSLIINRSVDGALVDKEANNY
jgi:hypothetical protein